MKLPLDAVSERVSRHTKVVIVAVLLVSVVMGAGMGQVSSESDLEQFNFGSDAEAAQDYVDANFQSGDEGVTRVQVVFRAGEDGDVLTQESLVREIELQQAIAADEQVAPTLTERPFTGFANVVATRAYVEQQGIDTGGNGLSPEQQPTLEEQRALLAGMTDQQFQRLLTATVAGENVESVAPFVPTDYEAGSTTAESRRMILTQHAPETMGPQASPPEAVTDAQLRIDELVDERYGDDGFTFAAGIVTDEIDRSMGDSMAIVLPLALLFVVFVLTIAYRDLLDILLGVSGIALVLVWTFGFMGWSGIAFNQIMIAVPVLLVGLSIDYAIHVFMRHREQRAADHETTREAMQTVLIGLGAALIWVTITAMIGFLSNLVSPLPPIEDFGLVSAWGIFATLVIYTLFVPAAKVELDEFLEGRGWDREKAAFGTGGGTFSSFLSGGETLARRAPWGVVLVVLLLTAGATAGATQVDTTFQQEDFLADDPPDWMDSLPEPFAPGEYQVKDQLDYVNERYSREDSNTQLLIRSETGGIANAETLRRIDRAESVAAEQDAIVTTPTGEASVQSPLRGMRRLAENDDSFAETFGAADTNGDGIPDQNVAGVFDAYLATAPQEASSVLYRNDQGEYEAARMVFSVRGDAGTDAAAGDTKTIADEFGGNGARATATGQLVVFNVIEEELFNSVVQSLIVTFVAVFAFLMVAYRLVHGSALLGGVTLTPIVLTVAWILGTMYLLDISFNVITGTITSLTIGLGVAYNIHVSERYRLELSRGKNPWEAVHLAVTGTGGALLGSAGTTVGGFGVLAFAILPPLQQFGIITGITIIYAFLGSVFVLPSFLVLWTQYLGPASPFDDDVKAEAPGVAPADE